MDKRIERIKEMEERLDRVTEWLKAAGQKVKASGDSQYHDDREIKEDIRLLDEYYKSEMWRTDFEADEKGELPGTLKRGVLSEDAIYNVLTEFDELIKNSSAEEPTKIKDDYQTEGKMSKKTLIVIDMQNDFVDQALGTKEAVAIVDNVKKKISEYALRGDEIIFTQDTHAENYLDTNEGKHLPVVHCIEGTEGWKIYDGLEVKDAKYIKKYSFGFTGWKDYDLQDVELVGLCTDICVVSNALIIKALYPEIPVKVDASCCAGVTPESHNAALETMKMCQIEII